MKVKKVNACQIILTDSERLKLLFVLRLLRRIEKDCSEGGFIQIKVTSNDEGIMFDKEFIDKFIEEVQ